MESISFEVIVILSLIVLNGFLAMSEMAIVSSNKIRLQSLANQGRRGARTALALIDNPSSLLASIQVGITLVGVTVGAFGGSNVADKVSAAMAKDFPNVAEYAEEISFAIVIMISTYLNLILGELVPKRMALGNPEKTASSVARVVWTISVFAKPAVKFLAFSTEFILKLFKLDKVTQPQVTEEEVKLLVEQGTEAGVFEAGEETIIKRTLRLGSLSAADIMTPRTKVISFDISDHSNDEVLDKVKNSKHTYFPVYDGHLDNIVGLLSAKRMLYEIANGRSWEMRHCMIEPVLVPESVSVLDVLENFKGKGTHVGIVIDEYGGMAGMLTIIDMMEAIVGSLPHEASTHHPKFVVREDGSMLLDGMTSLHEFEEIFRVNFANFTEGEDIQTIAGLLMKQMGRIPREGDVILLDHLRIEVVDMDGRRVDKILVHLPMQQDENAEKMDE